MGFFQPPLLKRAIQPKGKDSATMSTIAIELKFKFSEICNSKLIVEKVNNRNTPFNQKPTCQPLVLYNVLTKKIFRTPIIIG